MKLQNLKIDEIKFSSFLKCCCLRSLMRNYLANVRRMFNSQWNLGTTQFIYDRLVAEQFYMKNMTIGTMSWMVRAVIIRTNRQPVFTEHHTSVVAHYAVFSAGCVFLNKALWHAILCPAASLANDLTTYGLWFIQIQK